MNISAINFSTKPAYMFAFKSENQQPKNTVQTNSDEFLHEQGKNKKKKKKNLWSALAIGALVVAVIADVVVEHKLRVEKKAREEEKKLAEKIKNELEEKAKQLEEEIKKQKDTLDKSKKNGNSNGDEPPDINIDPPKS